MLVVAIAGSWLGFRFKSDGGSREMTTYRRADLPAVYRNLAFVSGPFFTWSLPAWFALALSAGATSLLGEQAARLSGTLGLGWLLVTSGLAFQWAYRPPATFYPAWFLAEEAALAIPRPIPDTFDRAVRAIGILAFALGVGTLCLGAVLVLLRVLW
jgi:hypothetical protein